MKTTYVCEICESVFNTKEEARLCEKSCEKDNYSYEYAIVYDKKYFVSGLNYVDKKDDFLFSVYKAPGEEGTSSEHKNEVKKVLSLLPASIRKLCKIHKIMFDGSDYPSKWKILEEVK